jgi:hypothetical protein
MAEVNELKMEVDVKNLDCIQQFLEVIAKHIDEMPDEVQEASILLADGISFYDIYYLERRGIPYHEATVYVDGEVTSNVVSGNPLTKTYTQNWHGDQECQSFWIVVGKEFICGWGDKPLLGE